MDQVLSRRAMLAAAGTSGVAALAGCSGGGGGGDGATNGTNGTSGETSDSNTPSSDGDSQVYDASLVNAYNGNPVDLHFNAYASQNYSWPAGRAVFAPLLKYSFNEDEFLYGALENLEIADQEVTMTFRDDITWSDGDEWTTEDFDVQLQLLEKTGNTLFGYVDDYEIVDDRTVRLALSGPTNPRIIRFELTNFFLNTKAETHEEWLDRETAELLQWAWEDPVATGMFSLASKDRQAFEFERNPQFYKSDNVNFQTQLIENTGGGSAQHQALISGTEVDAATSAFTPPEIADRFPDHVVEVNIPAKWGYGIVFNHDDPDFGNRNVRQAVAHVINRQSIVDNAGPQTKFTAPVPCGIAPEDQEYWLGDWMDDFETYGPESSNTDRAAELLQEAGYSRQNGTWSKEGRTLGGTYYSPAGWSDWTTMTQTVTSQLNDFGFDFSISTLPTNEWFTRYSESNFKMGSFYWLPGGSRSAFPYFPLYYQMYATDIGGGHNYRSIAQESQTVPGRDGGELTLDTPLSTAEQIARQSGDEEARPYVQQSAWYNHVDLPFLGLVSKYEQSWVTNDEWTEAPTDSPNRNVKWPQFWWVHEGDLQYDPQ
ncbi:extracellular solute-binding protein, family 5 [Candidatus Halobonum tyrrellensis G22]|uniref:Extracellular solute-binding protein, family 5 n=2 Tax=Candidatus Halobonum TaxID=1431544 RepID=V4GY16_9EURY|nr:extracellular solute-binding protein, family 5 [Candidatus Halobonum tyrrellensis G22]